VAVFWVDGGDRHARRSDLIGQLVLEVAALHPASLLTIDDARRVCPPDMRPSGLSDGHVLAVLEGVVELGVGLADLERVRQIVLGAVAVCPRIPDAIEEAFARLRARTLFVEMDPGTYASVSDLVISEDRIDGGDPRIKEAMREAIGVVYSRRLHELGLRLPVIFIRVDEFVRPEIRVRLNERTSPPIPVPAVNEVAAVATPAHLASLRIAARPLVDAITGEESSAVAASAQDDLRAAGIEPIPQYAHVAAAFARSAGSMAYRMVSIDEVEQDLAALELEHAPLVRAVLTRYSFAEITRILRALAREEVSIRDLRRILNVLLTFTDTTVPDLEAILLDDPLPEPGEEPSMPAGAWVEPRLLAFVRRELGDRVCHDGGLTVDGAVSKVHSTEENFERQVDLMRSSNEAAVDAVRFAVREEIWRALGADSESHGRHPLVLTAARTRLALRRTIEFELPGVCVLARGELTAVARVRASEMTLSAPTSRS